MPSPTLPLPFFSSEPGPAVSRMIRRTRYLSAAAAVLLSPIPFADEVFLLPVYGALTVRIARHHGLPMRRIPWRPIGGTAVAALAARAALGAPVAYIPGVAAVTNALSAATVTELLGRFVDGACRAPEGVQRLSFREIASAFRARFDARKAT